MKDAWEIVVTALSVLALLGASLGWMHTRVCHAEDKATEADRKAEVVAAESRGRCNSEDERYKGVDQRLGRIEGKQDIMSSKLDELRGMMLKNSANGAKQ